MAGPFKMNGFSGFGNSPIKQDKKNKRDKVKMPFAEGPDYPAVDMPDWKGPDEPIDPMPDPNKIFPLGPKKPIGKVTAKFTKKKMTKKFNPKKGPGATRAGTPKK